jgi:hypothetical protein
VVHKREGNSDVGVPIHRVKRSNCQRFSGSVKTDAVTTHASPRRLYATAIRTTSCSCSCSRSSCRSACRRAIRMPAAARVAHANADHARRACRGQRYTAQLSVLRRATRSTRLAASQSRSIEAAPDTVSTTTVTRKPSSHVIMWSVVFGVIVLCVIGYLAWRGDAPEETNYRVRG